MGRNEKKKNKQTNKTKPKKQIQNEKLNVKPRSLFSKFLVAEIFSFFCKHKRQLSIIGGGGRNDDDSGDRIQFSMNCNNKAKIFCCFVTTVRWSLLKQQDFDTVRSVKVCTIFKIAMVVKRGYIITHPPPPLPTFRHHWYFLITSFSSSESLDTTA